MSKFNKINGRWEDTCEKHNERVEMLIDLAKSNGCIEINAYEYGFGDDSCVYRYFLHKSAKYPGYIQLTEFWYDNEGGKYIMQWDSKVENGLDLCEITVHDFEVM